MLEVLSIAQNTANNFNNLVGKGANDFSDTQNFLNNSVGTLVSPQTIQGINGWIFDVAKTHQLEVEADITDHFMEDNSFTNDHVVIRPLIIQLSGYKGELVALKPSGFDAALNFLASKLSEVNDYLGDYTGQATQKMQEVISQVQSYEATVNQAISKTKNIIKQFSGETAFETAQSQAYLELHSFFLKKDLMTVQTPWAVFKNMKIQKISFNQPEDSADYSDISITLKEMRFVSTKTVEFSGNLTGYSKHEMQESYNKDVGRSDGDIGPLLFGYRLMKKK